MADRPTNSIDGGIRPITLSPYQPSGLRSINARKPSGADSSLVSRAGRIKDVARGRRVKTR